MTRPPGENAPDFNLPASLADRWQLGSFGGRRHVLLVFYSFSYDQVCREDLRWLREHADRCRAASVEVVAISCDPPPVQRAWTIAENLPFALLSDFWPHGAVSESYGVFDRERGCARHVVVAVGADGRIEAVSESSLTEARRDEEYEALLAQLDRPPAEERPAPAGQAAPEPAGEAAPEPAGEAAPEPAGETAPEPEQPPEPSAVAPEPPAAATAGEPPAPEEPSEAP